MPTKKILVKGIVQGVFYRAGAKAMADTIGITGWVKNTIIGDVELRVTGSTDQLNHFIDWCRRGSDRAVVTDVIVFDEPETEFEGFRVIK